MTLSNSVILLERTVGWWSAFLAWEKAGIMNCIPAQVVARWQRGRPAVLLAADDDGMILKVVGSRDPAPPLTLPWSEHSAAAVEAYLLRLKVAPTTPIGMVMPPAAFFYRTFGVPHRAVSHLDDVARQEISRRTPFKWDDIVQKITVLNSGKGKTVLTVQQAIVKRELVEGTARRLLVDTAILSFVIPRCGQFPSSAVSLRVCDDPRAAPRARLLRALVTSALLIAISDVGILWWVRDDYIKHIATEIDTLRPKSTAVRKTENEIALNESALQIITKRESGPNILHIWREISRVLPDDSWLVELRIHDMSVSLSGLSTKAANVVAALDSSSLFQNVSLDGPVTADPIFERDRFAVIATLKQTDVKITQQN